MLPSMFKKRYSFEKWLNLGIIPAMWACVLWLEWLGADCWYVWVSCVFWTWVNLRWFLYEYKSPVEAASWRLGILWGWPLIRQVICVRAIEGMPSD